MQCPYCNHQNSEYNQFCRACGRQLVAPKRRQAQGVGPAGVRGGQRRKPTPRRRAMQVQASTVTLLELALVAACAVAVACFFLPLVRAGWQGAENCASLFDVVAGTGNALSAGDSAFLTLLFVFPSVTIILGLMSDEPLRWVFYLLLGCFLVALVATGQLAGCMGVGVCLYAASGAVLVACSVAALVLHTLRLRAAACAA